MRQSNSRGNQSTPNESGKADPAQGRDSNDSTTGSTTRDQTGPGRPSRIDASDVKNASDVDDDRTVYLSRAKTRNKDSSIHSTPRCASFSPGSSTSSGPMWYFRDKHGLCSRCWGEERDLREPEQEVATDGGRSIERGTFWVIDPNRHAVLAGPFTDRRDARKAREHPGRDEIVTGDDLLVAQERKEVELTWTVDEDDQDDDVVDDMLTDGGQFQRASEAAALFASDPDPELTKFQELILAILAEEGRYGLAIKEELEDYYGEEVNHGRLYPNLDDLAEQGYVEIGEIDKRTNNYAITDAGRSVLEGELEWVAENAGFELERKGGDRDA